MKTKHKIFSLLLAAQCLLCSACGMGKSNQAVGKWYDGTGELLDIRSDGTYQRANDYGTGTWKYLEDGETIEFIDYYGDPTETKIIEDETGTYLDLGQAGTFYKERKISADNVVEVTYRAITPFCDGEALVKYEDRSGKKYAALITSKGKILYKLEDGNIDDYTGNFSSDDVIGNTGGLYVINKYESGKIKFYLIDEKGKPIDTSKTEFDRVVHCRGGMALVYQDRSDPGGKHDCYGVIDKNGKWAIPLTDLGDTDFWYSYNNTYYANNGIFQIIFGGPYTDQLHQSILFNSKNGRYKVIKTTEKIDFYDGTAYFYRDGAYYGIDTDFKEKKIGEYDHTTGGYLIKVSNSYLSIFNPKTNKTAVFRDYPAEDDIDGSYAKTAAIQEFKNGYGLVSIIGKDKNNYFTVIDENAKMQFEPIKGCAYGIDAGMVFYKDYYQTTLNAVDLKGNLIIEELSEHISDDNCSFVGLSEDIILFNQHSKYYHYVDLTGTEILRQLYE